MAQKLTGIYEEIKKVDGMRGQMRLAMLTGMPSTIAASAPDTPENILKFNNAYREIAGKECPIK